MAMIKRMVEDAEQLGIEWLHRRTEDVMQDISLMRLGIQQGYLDAPADFVLGDQDETIEDWEEPDRDARGASDGDESDYYAELERGFEQDRI